MPNHFHAMIKYSTVATLAALFAGCGGGGDSEGDDEAGSGSFSTFTGAPGNGVNGQKLSADKNCAGCHGPSFSPAKNSARTLSRHSNLVTQTQADDIASYLTYGASTPNNNTQVSNHHIRATGQPTTGYSNRPLSG
jgi:mono/diheme cytochrome c family protein